MAGRSLRAKILAAETAFAALQFQLALKFGVSAERKFNPNWANQPRVPAGNWNGGQWTDGSATLTDFHEGSSPSGAGGVTGILTRNEMGRIGLRPAKQPKKKKPGSVPLGWLKTTGSPIGLSLMLSGDTPKPIMDANVVPGTTDLAFIRVRSRTTGVETGYFARIVAPERLRPLTIFGRSTGVDVVEPPRLAPLDVPVSIVGSEARFDADALAREYGRPLPSMAGATVAPGSGMETQSDEERDLVEAMRAAGRSSAEIEAAVSTLRTGRRAAQEGRNPRYVPGTAYTSAKHSVIKGKWLKDSQIDSGRVPAQIVERLEGRRFRSIDEFRSAFWVAVAETPELARQFSTENTADMKLGYGPLAPPEQQYKSFQKYIIHHETPTAKGGAVYDMGNMIIVSPKQHQEILDPSYHFGRSNPAKTKKGLFMTREEMIAAVVRLRQGARTEKERDDLVWALTEAAPHSQISGLIYYPDKKRTPEEIVDEALRRERAHR